MQQEPLQSSAVADTPNNVLEPVSRMIEGRGIVRKQLAIVVYGNRDEEMDRLMALVKEVVEELGAEAAVRLTARSWKLWQLFQYIKGVTRPPILEIAGVVYSQGVVPEKAPLKNHIRDLLV